MNKNRPNGRMRSPDKKGRIKRQPESVGVTLRLIGYRVRSMAALQTLRMPFAANPSPVQSSSSSRWVGVPFASVGW